MQLLSNFRGSSSKVDICSEGGHNALLMLTTYISRGRRFVWGGGGGECYPVPLPPSNAPPVITYYLIQLILLQPALLENQGDYVRVVVTEINSRIQYKTLPITEYTTAYEVVVKIVTKFAVESEDKDPDCFYITEVNILQDWHFLMFRFCHSLHTHAYVHTCTHTHTHLTHRSKRVNRGVILVH